MQQISATELNDWLSDPDRPSPLLLDVREPREFDLCRLDEARLMPMASVPARMAELDPAADTVLICHHGARSMQVALFLEHQGFTRLYNLAGGIAAWSRDVNPSLPTY
ncbi:MAG: sulfurtransferase [Proteobacteria bacterium]|nr:sulfurtransferase [Pseudomonadota bacterium]HQR03858.1 rhodanese-like domain-containing protein [Rhodocyclaceae bacterium]